jgi:glycosyltransferase involved in cell wall biosynthesis
MHVPVSTPGIAAHIEYFGFRELPEAINLLSECDMTYLPYWLDPKYQDSVLGCFPDKLSTYVAAGKPILYHGPYESSPRKFFDRFPIGITCHSHDPWAMVECFNKIATDDDLHSRAFDARKSALSKELSPEVFQNRLMKLVSTK